MNLFERHLKLDLLGDNGSGGGGGQGGGDGSGAAGGGDGSGGGTGNGGSGGTTSVPDFKTLVATLPEELRNEGSLKNFNNFTDFAKSFVHAQKSIGKDKITVPDKHATRDDYVSILRKLGVPEKVEDYKLSKGEKSQATDEFMKKFSEVAHKSGIFPWQAEELLNWYESEVRSAAEKADNEYKEQIQKGIDALQKEWGQGFKAQVAKANVAFKELLPNQEDRQALIDMGFGNNPHLVRLLANAAKLMKEDVFVGKGEGLTTMTREEALAKARAIIGDPNHPYRNPSHPNHMAAKKEVQALYKEAYPDS